MNEKTIYPATKLIHIHTENAPETLLYTFELNASTDLREKEITLSVFFNIELTCTALLTHISKNIENFRDENDLRGLGCNEILAIVSNLNRDSYPQKLGFNFAIRWRKLSFSNCGCLYFTTNSNAS